MLSLSVEMVLSVPTEVSGICLVSPMFDFYILTDGEEEERWMRILDISVCVCSSVLFRYVLKF